MKKETFFICGVNTENNTWYRSTIRNCDCFQEACLKFLAFHNNASIISIYKLSNDDADWLNRVNMPDITEIGVCDDKR